MKLNHGKLGDKDGKSESYKARYFRDANRVTRVGLGEDKTSTVRTFDTVAEAKRFMRDL